ncbi:Cytidine deaminase [Corynebacterium kutscheri]|uniref:Cytidine deaminase n=1 Tax=Corynebacterium kutscheri TaxID=35755 RepID=A0A0F6TDF4_9CORY|nr:cytidine deaminase [Corynebacterium kutscheri]AKE41139.1 cytidine deaminase [Corynebacterium kutscheri]VEH07048.1 Cytidine deaminase [Corynebacterium kutscheri]VEH09459.1 Cytidine deaminase [Corynebacterium kutscheri]VEH79544.1 Cytidine deaminase [Corynebacterium kutscheri]
MSAPNDAELLTAAHKAAENAYAPYSNFPVGAAIWDGNSDVLTLGCNVENAAYGETICAERNAMTTLVSSGVKKIHTVAIIGSKAARCYPCGACRQVLREFGCERIIVEDEEGNPLSYSFEEILPFSFGPEYLPTTAARNHGSTQEEKEA